MRPPGASAPGTTGRPWGVAASRSGEARSGLSSALLTALVVVGTGAYSPIEAQAPAGLAASCVQDGGDLGLCLAAATAGYSLLGHSSLAAGLGSPVPGTASNLGTRVGAGPRLSFYGQTSVSSWDLPSPTALDEEASSSVPGLRVGAAAGIFDGFRLMPTVGGFLATDVFADASFLFPGGSDGFGGGMRWFSVGARVGLFREGFTIPGVSVSVARRFSGALDYGDVPGGDVVAVGVDPGVTSVRATVGKDLLAVELLGGFGWDDFSGESTLRVSDGSGGSLATSGTIDGSRRLYFGSASMTFSLVFVLTAEVGWAEGLMLVPAYAGPHDPTSGSLFGSFSARLVL